MIDYFIAGLVILGVILSVRYLYRQAQSGKGCCGGCSGCNNSCTHWKEQEK